MIISDRWGEADGRIQPASQRNMQNWKVETKFHGFR
jgi:hypothetical protein